MTMPSERTNERARCAALGGRVHKELINAGELSEKRKHETPVIPRHYPSATEIVLQFSDYLQISQGVFDAAQRY